MPEQALNDDIAGGSRVRSERLILAVVSTAQFMVIADATIVNVALHDMQLDLGLSASALTWVINAYALLFAGFLLFGGRAADLWGRRRLFLLGAVVFTTMSLLGGFAQNGGQLIAARAVQGLGAAALSPATLTILMTTFTQPRARARALGIWAAVAGAGGATGVLAGGVLTDLLSWRWVLFVNVPIGVLLVFAARAYIPESRSRTDKSSLDYGGAITVTGGLLAVVYAIVSTDTHPWASTFVIGFLVLGAALLMAFISIELRHRHPLVTLAIFRSRSVTGANLVLFFIFPANFTVLYFLSQYLQNVRDYSPLLTGIAFLPMPIAFIISSQLTSRIVGRTHTRPLIVAGALIATTGLVLLSQLGVRDSYLLHVGLPAAMTMFGLGMAYVSSTLSASRVDPAYAGLASGLINTTRNMGGAIGLAAMVTVATARTHAHAIPTSDNALTAGYASAFAACAGLTVLAALVALTVLPVATLNAPPVLPDVSPSPAA